jgi:putative FmdB family regulatory protein
VPIYEYQCKKCGHKFEKIQLFSDPPIKKCPECGGAVEKLISRSAVQFKGTGWYVTDYAKKSDGGGSAGSASGAKNSAESTPAPTADAPATKSESADSKESKPKKTDSGSGKKAKK